MYDSANPDHPPGLPPRPHQAVLVRRPLTYPSPEKNTHYPLPDHLGHPLALLVRRTVLGIANDQIERGDTMVAEMTISRPGTATVTVNPLDIDTVGWWTSAIATGDLITLIPATISL